MNEAFEVVASFCGVLEELQVSHLIGGSLARSSFNVLHRETVFKVDVFIAGDDPWFAEELRRARVIEIPGVGGLRFGSVEDVVLHKLRWYDEGGRVSERQWRDVLGMIAVHGDALDRVYLDRWADHLRVRGLLEVALDS